MNKERRFGTSKQELGDELIVLQVYCFSILLQGIAVRLRKHHLTAGANQNGGHRTPHVDHESIERTQDRFRTSTRTRVFLPCGDARKKRDHVEHSYHPIGLTRGSLFGDPVCFSSAPGGGVYTTMKFNSRDHRTQKLV